MKIVRLDLARFRHFTGRSLDFASPAVVPSSAATLSLFPEGEGRLCVVHGQNEAGKSTVLEAVKCLLFGFPDRAAHLAIDAEQSALEVSALVEFQSGARVEVRRRKGKKNTLVGHLVLKNGALGDEIDADWFHDKMGRPNDAVFDAVFGSSLDTLAKGAETLAKDVQGAIYGAGFGGAVKPQEILADLDAAKSALFAERGTSRRINAAKMRLDELRKTIAAASATKEALQALDEELHQKELAADDRAARAKRLREEIERGKALLAGLEPFRAREAAREELAALEVPRTFPTGGDVEHRRLVDERTRWIEERDEQRTTLEVAAREIEALTVDEALLADAEAIDALYRGLEGLRQAMLDAPRCDAELAVLSRATTTTLGTLRPGWDLEALRAARFDAAAKADFDKALVDHERLAAQTTAAQAAVQQLEEDLASVAERLSSLPAVADPSAARAWLQQCSGALAEQEGLDRLERELAGLERKRAALRRKLDPPCVAAVDPSHLVVPRVEEVERFAASFVALDERIARLEADLATHESDVARLDAELAEIEAGGHAPSEAELKAARDHREQGWRLVLRGLAGEKPDEKTIAEFDREKRPLPRAFEHAVQLADGLADAMRARADAVQKRAICEAHRARALKAVATATKKRAAAADERAREEAAWSAAWSTCAFPPLPPRAMRGWLGDLAAFTELAHHEAEARSRRDQLVTRLQEFVQRGREALPGVVTDSSLERTRGEGQRLVDAADARDKQRSSLQAQHDRDVPRLASARDILRGLRAEADRFLARWSSITHTLGIEGGLSIDAARKVVPDLVDLQRSFVRLENQLKSRRAAIGFELDRLCEAVRSLAPDAAMHADPLATVARLHRELQATREAMRARAEATKRLSAAEAQRAIVEHKLEAVDERLARLRSLAGVSDDEAFAAVARRAALATELSRVVDDTSRAMVRHRGPWSIAEYESQLASSSPDALRIDLERLAAEADSCEAELRVLERGVGDARAQRNKLDGNAIAAEALSRAESERATLREDVERYAVLAIAESLLSGAIHRFEKEHQPALLETTSRIFGEMTLGRYLRVQRKLADASLFVERDDGRTLGPEQLSTGTREQLYLAIRLAYVDHYRRSAEALPVVLDDVLVNFDDGRALATLRALSTFAKRTQVLLFTCHAHLVALVEKESLDVSRLTLPAWGVKALDRA